MMKCIPGFLASLMMVAVAGCSGSPGHPAGASPIVSLDSEAGQKAHAESEALLKLRQRQEAKAKRRGPAPVE